MKKRYVEPKAEMWEFNYEETVVASGDIIEATGHGNGGGNSSANSCTIGNTSNIVGNDCIARGPNPSSNH